MKPAKTFSTHPSRRAIATITPTATTTQNMEKKEKKTTKIKTNINTITQLTQLPFPKVMTCITVKMLQMFALKL